jgi:hypothetical protein
MKPVLPRYGRWGDRLVYKPREYLYRWTRSILERRYYRRTMSFNCTGWAAIREAAEPYRRKALQVLDETALAEVLGHPDERRAAYNGAEDSSKAKILTGFLLWSASYL